MDTYREYFKALFSVEAVEHRKGKAGESLQ